MTEPESLAHSRRKAALLFVFVTVSIDMLAFGIIIPVLPHLIVQLIGGSIAKAAVWSSGFGTVFRVHSPTVSAGAP
jgi:DHA1 family tetracycline resistance protein-like MFS transporter